MAIRTPLKDRVLYRSETAVRAFWDRDHESVVQVLGSRSNYPGRAIAVREGDLDWLDDLPFDEPFEPGADRLLFGLADSDNEFLRVDVDDRGTYDTGDSFWFAHPLADAADAFYRFRSGDTLTISLPDGRQFEAVELEVLPREADAHRITGVLWIEPRSGALVRAVYRMSRKFDVWRDVPEMQEEDNQRIGRFVPGIFKPWTFDLKMIAVDYGLWDFRVWLPRSMRVEGEAAAGVLKLPVSMEVSYQIESVATDADAVANAGTADAATDAAIAAAGPVVQEVHFETRAEAMAFIAGVLAEGDVAYEVMDEAEGPARDRESLLIVPTERSRVAESPHLPPPIWEETPGFPPDDELEEYLKGLAKLPAPPMLAGRIRTGVGPVRYNRVEGLALGGSVEADLGRRYSARAEGLFGLANLRPDLRVELRRSTVLRRLSAEMYYEMRAWDRQEGNYFELGNSASAFFRGRDWGDYYRAAGAALSWQPPELARQSFLFRVFAERQTAVKTETNFALFKAFSDGWTFRTNPAADEVNELGTELHLSPWWGRDPTSAQFGVEFVGRGATWRFLDSDIRRRYLEAGAVARAAFPLSGGEWSAWRLGMELGGGSIWGEAPVQRTWHLGGSNTLRGFSPAAATGASFLRGRLEVARTYHGIGGSVFGDTGWAGDPDALSGSDFLYSVGVGATIMDGLLRLDLARSLNGPDPSFRLHMSADAIL